MPYVNTCFMSLLFRVVCLQWVNILPISWNLWDFPVLLLLLGKCAYRSAVLFTVEP